jgi:integrase
LSLEVFWKNDNRGIAFSLGEEKKLSKREYSTYKTRVIPPGEVKATILKQSRPWMKSLIAFLYIFGCRISEALDTRVGDVMFDSANDLVGVTIRVGKKKTKNYSHVVWATMDTPFIDLFLDRLRGKSKGGRMVTRLWPYTRQAAWYHLNKANPNLSAHSFRHSRLRRLADQGASEWEIRDFAGWEDITPARAYITSSTKRLKGLADKLK